MFKVLVILISGLLVMGASCSVKSELKDLQELKTECDSLEIELASLKARKWTKVIDERADKCREHGFWSGKLDKKKRKTERKELLDEFGN